MLAAARVIESNEPEKHGTFRSSFERHPKVLFRRRPSSSEPMRTKAARALWRTYKALLCSFCHMPGTHENRHAGVNTSAKTNQNKKRNNSKKKTLINRKKSRGYRDCDARHTTTWIGANVLSKLADTSVLGLGAPLVIDASISFVRRRTLFTQCTIHGSNFKHHT